MPWASFPVDAQGNKYLLDVAKIPGQQISGATAEPATNSNQWQVIVNLKSGGATSFSNLTSQLVNKYYTAGGDNPATADYWLDTVAIVLDGQVVSAPVDHPGHPGWLGPDHRQLHPGPGPAAWPKSCSTGRCRCSSTPRLTDSVSPSLGHAQLTAGLIAAAIGLGLVVVYSFFYYRGLGIVSVSSLIIAGVLALLSVILLSKYQNFALELSGIAGLIVAIGITADSFVVFFERLRDEVREGKQLRPAVEAGWKRARRTILVSDTVSFIAALLLYYFSIGEVKGFAYTLGLTTIIDIVVVFLFTKPMVTLLARTSFFGDGHPMSGLDPARLGARTPWRSSVRRTQVRRGPDGKPRNPVTRSTTGEA